MSFCDHVTAVARRKVAVEGWEPFRWERLGETDTWKLTGGIPVIAIKGKNAGKPSWKGVTRHVAYVNEAEVADEQERYEAETGKCHGCLGEGRELARLSVTEGATYRDCSICKGTGKSKAAEMPSLPFGASV